jgi:hypothetical protein
MELNKLEDQEIVYKVKTEYRLRLTWIISMQMLTDQMFRSHTQAPSLENLLRSQETKVTDKFTNLRRLDSYWIQLMVALHSIYPEQPMYLWCPYQWFHLVHYSQAHLFYRTVERLEGSRYHIIGHDSYLARQGAKDLPKGSQYSFAESPFKDEVNTYYSSIGSHLITVKLSPETTAQIDQLFRAVRSKADLDPERISRLFDQSVRASLKIEFNPKKAASFQRKVQRFFEVF